MHDRCVRIQVVGGLFDGAEVEMPWRTPPGLALNLVAESGEATYSLVGVGEQMRVVPASGIRGGR